MKPADTTTKFVFVTAHAFGQRALEGLLSSASYLKGDLECGGIFTFILVVCWSRLVHDGALQIPSSIWGPPGGSKRNSEAYGCIGMHPTRLPMGRGQAPIPWTIIRGVKETALSTFFLEKDADSGGIVRQLPLTVGDSETATSLFLRFSDLHFHAGRLLASELANRRVPSERQDDSLSSVWPRRNPSDSEISLHCHAEELGAFVRALRWPYPGAFLVLGERELLVHACEIRDRRASNEVPRVIEVTSDGAWVRILDADVFLRGRYTSSSARSYPDNKNKNGIILE